MLSKQNLIELDQIPDIKLIKKDPVKSFIFAYLDVIRRFDLTLPEFDPDLLTQFIIELSSKSISSHFYTIFLAFYLTLMVNYFHHINLKKKFQLFVLLLSRLVNVIEA